jgi:release factor glutamine methyltransferase
MTTVAQAIDAGRALGVDRLDAQLIVARHAGVTRPWLMAHPDSALDDAQWSACRDDFIRRADGVPLAYLAGEREFHGLRLKVTSDVLDPRPDTETLVDWALELLDDGPRAVVDLGTGSGAIALAVRHARPHAEVVATDASGAALRIAHENSRRLGLDIRLSQGDWWAAVGHRRFHLALSNPPYIAAADPHLARLEHEPMQALTPGPSGLEAIERIVSGAPAHLLPGGWLLLEHGHDQAEAVRAELSRHGFCDVRSRDDLAGIRRCSGGRRRV